MAMARQFRPFLCSRLSGALQLPPPTRLIFSDGSPSPVTGAFLAAGRPFPSFHRVVAFSTSPGIAGRLLRRTIVLIGSTEQFNAEISKVKDEKSHAIFYFSAAWCGPCKSTFHFYQVGQRASEMVGADAAQLKDTMENIYK